MNSSPRVEADKSKDCICSFLFELLHIIFELFVPMTHLISGKMISCKAWNIGPEGFSHFPTEGCSILIATSKKGMLLLF